MVEELKSKGIYPVKDIAELKDGIVAFRTHGIKKEEEGHIGKRSFYNRCNLSLCKAGEKEGHFFKKEWL
jgi:hypothetical protein